MCLEMIRKCGAVVRNNAAYSEEEVRSAAIYGPARCG
jgi:hypothetical protein